MKKRSMLEHQKLVISNVAHNEQLVKKELTKSQKWLTPIEYKELVNWVKASMMSGDNT